MLTDTTADYHHGYKQKYSLSLATHKGLPCSWLHSCQFTKYPKPHKISFNASLQNIKHNLDLCTQQYNWKYV